MTINGNHMPKTATIPSPFPPRALIALQAALFIAYHGGVGRPVAGAQIAARYRLSQRALEPVLQPLARAGILTGQPGAHGGYFIADPEAVTAAMVMDCFMERLQPEHLAFTHFAGFLTPHLAAAHNALHATLETLTLAELCAQAEAAGLPRALDVTIDYMI